MIPTHRKLLYAIEPLGRRWYVIRWIDDGVPHAEVRAGDPMPRLVELGLVAP